MELEELLLDNNILNYEVEVWSMSMGVSLIVTGEENLKNIK